MAEVLEAAARLFASLNDEKVRYCHWKSNEHLLEGLAGLTDLDVLFCPDDREKTEWILQREGYLRVHSQYGSRYPGVEDWLTCDRKTGRMIHIHLHYRMITGHRGMKEYTFPWSEQALETRVPDPQYGVYVIDPNLEIIVLLSRIGLKATAPRLIRARMGKFRLSEGDQREIAWLTARCDRTRVRRLLSGSFGKQADRMEELIFAEKRDANWFLRLHACTASVFRNSRRFSAAGCALRRAWYAFALKFRLFSNKYLKTTFFTRKNLGEGAGVLVAFLGQDGAGKSTVTAEVSKWLRWKLDVRKYYMGSGDHYSSWQKKLRKIIGKGGPGRAINNMLTVSDLNRLARHCVRLTHAAAKYAAKGGIAIFDRYPQTQFEGLNDGPKIHERSAGKKLPGPLKGYIRRKGDQEIRHYEEATRVAPDLVIKMILPPEVSIQRKPQESLENVTRKHEIIQRLAFPDSEVLTVDATMDYEAELALIHNAIWDIIQKKQAGSARA